MHAGDGKNRCEQQNQGPQRDVEADEHFTPPFALVEAFPFLLRILGGRQRVFDVVQLVIGDWRSAANLAQAIGCEFDAYFGESVAHEAGLVRC